MFYFLIFLPFYTLSLSWMCNVYISENEIDNETALVVVLDKLGNETHLKKVKEYSLKQIEIGEDLVKNGYTKKRKGSKVISVYFQCTSCHNLVQEDPFPNNPDPQERLAYSDKEGIPFLQATTFWGIVNRESWYNGDYLLKYGSLVEKARDNIEEAIQLCAQECSQGRKLKQWEVDAIMAYFWELELKVSDLELSKNELSKLNNMSTEKEKSEILNTIRDKYMLASPASFTDAPNNKAKGYAVKDKDPINGKLVFENSCMHCHDQNGVTEYKLNDSKLSFKKLRRDMGKNTTLSFYQVIRYGTSPGPGYRPYMPHYTLERMSNQQVEDLRAYIEQEAL